jgi:hypothetical protein
MMSYTYGRDSAVTGNQEKRNLDSKESVNWVKKTKVTTLALWFL